MVLTFEQMKEIEVLKQKNKENIILAEDSANEKEHTRKMMRLEKQLEIAKIMGVKKESEDKQNE